MNLKNLFKPRGQKMTSEELVRSILAGGEAASGVAVNTTTAMRTAAAFACWRVLSNAIAQAPLFVYKKTENGLEKATNHRVYKLLHDAPNDFMTAYQFRQLMAGNVINRGHAFAFKNIVAGEVQELLPIHPDKVEVKQGSDYKIKYHITGAGGAVTVYDRSQILHLSGNGGTSVISAAREAIGMAIATEKHGAKLFKNGVRSSGNLQIEKGRLSDEAFARLKEDFDNSFVGLENSHKPLILEEGLKWVANSMTNEDAQFLETRKFTVIEVCRFYGVPPHKVYDLDKATFSNIEHQALEFVQDSLMPYFVNFEQDFKLQLLTPKEREQYEIRHSVDGMLRGDFKTRVEGYQMMLQNGVLNVNEVRQLENLNKREGGDDYNAAVNIYGDPNQGAKNAK